MIANWPQLTAFASVFFILFLRSLAVYLNRDDLAKKAVILLTTSFIIQGFFLRHVEWDDPSQRYRNAANHWCRADCRRRGIIDGLHPFAFLLAKRDS